MWFFPEVPNGWSTQGGKGEQWFSVDFGKPTKLGSAELAFFADGKAFAVPAGYRLQVLRGMTWTDVARDSHPVENGISRSHWRPVSARQVRVLFKAPAGKAVRIVELKLF